VRPTSTGQGAGSSRSHPESTVSIALRSSALLAVVDRSAFFEVMCVLSLVAG
jgi:hypothetical protein